MFFGSFLCPDSFSTSTTVFPVYQHDVNFGFMLLWVSLCLYSPENDNLSFCSYV